MFLLQCIGVGLISVFCILDSRILGRLNFERPLITCTMVGILLGDVQTGLLVGAQMEMVTLGMMSIGASGVDMNMGSIVGCALVIMTGTNIEMALTVAVPMTVLSNILGMISSIVRIQFTHMCDNYVEASNYKMAKVVHSIYGPILYSLFNFIPVFLTVYFGADVVNAITEVVPEWVNNGVSLGANIISFYGFALLLSTMVNKNNVIFFFVGFVISAYSGLGLTAMAVISIVCAFLLYQLRYQDRPTGTTKAVESKIDPDYDELEDLDN